MTVGRPVLRYFGGKWRIAPWIIENFPEHRIYTEPFGGGASVLMLKPRTYGEIYNDLDGEVVNVFRVLRDRHRRLRRLLEATPFARDELELAQNRRFVKDPVERARRTIIRSFMGFGADSVTRKWRTGFRSNSSRAGTTPAHDWASWPVHIEAFHERLRGVVIENRDALEVMLSQDSDETLHYCDPPYVHATRSDIRTRGLKTNGHGYRHEMTDQDHLKLIDFLAGLKGMVVLSGYPTPIYDRLGWEYRETRAMTFHRGNVGSPRTERLWLNPSAVKAMRQMKLFQEVIP